VSCGDDPPRLPTTLSLTETYDVAGVGRVLADGITPSELKPIYLLFDEIAVEGEQWTGLLQRKGTSERWPMSGTFDGDNGRWRIEQLEATLTSTFSERVEEFGAVADADVRPRDGMANEAFGFLRTRQGSRVFDGTFLAISRGPNRPDRPDETRISAKVESLGLIEIVGETGAIERGLSLEIFRYRLGTRDPTQIIDRAQDDGSFLITMEANAGDMLLIRTLAAGVASDARAVPVLP
jgi:hypothetical protein